MGNLVKETPYSEVTATLELLDRRGVGRVDLTKLRAATPEIQKHIAYILKNADVLTRISSFVQEQRAWREKDGIIYFSVTSDGTTGEDWIKRLEGNGFRLEDHAKQVLRSPSFVPTSGVTTEIAVLKGKLFKDHARIESKIRAEADKRKLIVPNAELACLIREKFTDKEIKQMRLLFIIVMHEPINESWGVGGLLGARRDFLGPELTTSDGGRGTFGRGCGFAFVVSQS